MTVYVNLLNLFVFPLIILSIVFGLGQFSMLPKSPLRFLVAILLGLLGLFLSGLISIFIGLIFSPGLMISDDLRMVLGNLSLDKDPVLSIAHDSSATAINIWALGKFAPANILHAFAYESLASSMIGALIFGLGFSFLPSLSIKSLFDRLEVIYISLEYLISLVNKSLPFVAFIFAVNIVNGVGQGRWGLITHLIFPMLVSIMLAGSLSVSLVAWAAGVRFTDAINSLARPLFISFLAKNPAAGVPEVIYSLSDTFGFKRSMVRFLAPLFPIFFNAGEMIFFTMLSIFVANLYGQVLSYWALLQILTIAVISTFLSASLIGMGSMVIATFMLQAFNLPFDALLPSFVALEIFLAGAKSALSLLFASTVIALVSKGLMRESQPMSDEVDEALGPSILHFSIDKKILMLLYGLLLVFLSIIFAIGLGVGALSTKTLRKPELEHNHAVLLSYKNSLNS